MPHGNNPLREQLDEQKFSRALNYVRQNSSGLKKLTSTELAQLNQMMTGHEEVWRTESVKIQIPSGQIQEFNLISNPLARAREIIGHAHDMAANQKFADAAFYLYAELVMEHLFKDANRRTAVLAVVWALHSNGHDLDAQKLLKIKIGNLRDPKDQNALKSEIHSLVR